MSNHTLSQHHLQITMNEITPYASKTHCCEHPSIYCRSPINGHQKVIDRTLGPAGRGRPLISGQRRLDFRRQCTEPICHCCCCCKCFSLAPEVARRSSVSGHYVRGEQKRRLQVGLPRLRRFCSVLRRRSIASPRKSVVVSVCASVGRWSAFENHA